VRSEEEAVALANDTPFGLGSYVMTNNLEQAERVADRIDAGMVYVNIVGADAAELHSVARNAPASDASSAATAPTSSSTRS
jgi:acyl-CoA reductase-like NAD-dependent aldehyde dehydrogenase